MPYIPSPNGTSARLKVKAADESVNNTTTTQADDELSLNIGVNETLVGRFVLWVVNASSTTPHFRCKVTGPAGASIRFSAEGNRSTDYLRQDSAYQSGSAASVSTRGTTGSRVVVDFWVGNGATAGTVGIEWAQDVATAENTTVKAGSWVEAFPSAA